MASPNNEVMMLKAKQEYSSGKTRLRWTVEKSYDN